MYDKLENFNSREYPDGKKIYISHSGLADTLIWFTEEKYMQNSPEKARVCLF